MLPPLHLPALSRTCVGHMQQISCCIPQQHLSHKMLHQCWNLWQLTSFQSDEHASGLPSGPHKHMADLLMGTGG